jgi:hypothetical protein
MLEKILLSKMLVWRKNFGRKWYYHTKVRTKLLQKMLFEKMLFEKMLFEQMLFEKMLLHKLLVENMLPRKCCYTELYYYSIALCVAIIEKDGENNVRENVTIEMFKSINLGRKYVVRGNAVRENGCG